MSPFPLIDGATAWLDFGRTPNSAFQLMLSLPSKVRPACLPFWLEMSPTAGGLIGWMRFDYVTTLKGEAIFAAGEWRPATDPAPHPADVWLGVLSPRLAAPATHA